MRKSATRPAGRTASARNAVGSTRRSIRTRVRHAGRTFPLTRPEGNNGIGGNGPRRGGWRVTRRSHSVRAAGSPGAAGSGSELGPDRQPVHRCTVAMTVSFGPCRRSRNFPVVGAGAQVIPDPDRVIPHRDDVAYRGGPGHREGAAFLPSGTTGGRWQGERSTEILMHCMRAGRRMRWPRAWGWTARRCGSTSPQRFRRALSGGQRRARPVLMATELTLPVGGGFAPAGRAGQRGPRSSGGESVLWRPAH